MCPCLLFSVEILLEVHRVVVDNRALLRATHQLVQVCDLQFVKTRVADPFHFYMDPDPDPDPLQPILNFFFY